MINNKWLKYLAYFTKLCKVCNVLLLSLRCYITPVLIKHIKQARLL